ncbi:hypothetical protein RMN57_13015 [Kitasatospora sp. CM 4170]|uniref:Uncharacterized protein n=1 Tax=Kitasatospora aburaviensis TaxID=67265 RepID=A0ABW1F2H0_9ACTN|nr:hypothetical protein [Kitasatospora sp. CM 4170]WNM45574.1 hypothetical protein RMN57_13015 [Kitasatospora sp. CM 4170]
MDAVPALRTASISRAFFALCARFCRVSVNSGMCAAQSKRCPVGISSW